MIVTFVSQCEKKALNKIRRALDSFANRIGSRTWQTVIPNEDLQAGKNAGAYSKNGKYECEPDAG